jgi:hypothetical protein
VHSDFPNALYINIQLVPRSNAISIQATLVISDLTLRVFVLRDYFSERINRVIRGFAVQVRYKNNTFMLYREIIAVRSDIRTKHTNVLHRKNVEFPYSDH